jgi:FG-GAP repeat
MSGRVLVAGAPQAMVEAGQDQGAVYLFTRPTGGWSDETEAAKLIASDGASGDYFGSSVAISGDTVVAGSAGPAVCTLALCPGQLASGKLLYVFSKPRGGWSGTVPEDKPRACN